MSDPEELDAPEWRLVLSAAADGEARSGEHEPVTMRGDDVNSRSERAELALALELELASEYMPERALVAPTRSDAMRSTKPVLCEEVALFVSEE